MDNMDWLRQVKDPAFPDILWSRPENKRHAGKLLIVGGHKQNFNDVSQAYSAASKAGAGTIRVIVPDSLQKMLHTVFPEAEYAASTKIGSFSRQALGTLLDAAAWADAVLLAGDFGRNSETAILLEGFVEKFDGKLTLAGDSLDYFLNQPARLTDRQDTLVAASLGQLQKLALPHLIQQNADFMKAVEQVKKLSSEVAAYIVTIHSNQVIVSAKQQISTTPAAAQAPIIDLAAFATVWWLQQPEKPFEALTTAVYCL